MFRRVQHILQSARGAAFGLPEDLSLQFVKRCATLRGSCRQISVVTSNEQEQTGKSFRETLLGNIHCVLLLFRMAALGTGGPKESTEWDDILKAKGIIPEKSPDEEAQEQLKDLVEEVVEAYDPIEQKTLNDLDEDLEDADSDEEDILQSYRQKRMQEMRAEAMKPKFGPGVTYISATDWKQEVTDGGDEVYIIVHLVRYPEAIFDTFICHSVVITFLTLSSVFTFLPTVYRDVRSSNLL